MPHAIIFISLATVAGLFALVEVRVEGPNGWAASLPIWRIENRWTRSFYSAKPVMGYQLYPQLFLLAIIHLPFGLGLTPATWRAEVRVLAFFILLGALEDLLRFILSPAFSLKRFRPQYIWWHAPTWW